MDTNLFNLNHEQLRAMMPLLFLCGSIVVSVMLSAYKARGGILRMFGVLSFGIFVGLAISIFKYPDQDILGSSLHAGFLMKSTEVTVGILAALASLFTFEDEHPEWLALLQIVVVGLCLVVGTRDWVSFFVYLETFAIPSYILAAFRLRRDAGFEAGIKYLMMGAFSSALFLLGITLLYGFSGSFDYLSQLEALRNLNDQTPGGLVYAGFTLIVVSVGFKVALAPFHMWAPDVYQAAPSPLAGFLSTAVKFSVFVAAFAAFSQSGLLQVPFFQVALSGLGVLSILVGNLMALKQKNLRRMIAYASVASAGYAAVAFAAGPVALSSVLIYLAIYGVNVMAFFAILEWASRSAGYESSSQIDVAVLKEALKGRPVYLCLFGCVLFSLVGIPPLPGFLGKFLILRDLLRGDLYVEAGAVLLGSLLSLAYYLRIFVPIAFDTEASVEKGKRGIVPAAVGLAFFASGIFLLAAYWGLNEYFKLAGDTSVFLR